jgi:hypothetical protein
MVLVPLGIVLLGRSLGPTLDRLEALAASTPVLPVPAPAAAVAPAMTVKVVDGDGSAVAGASVHVLRSGAAGVEVVREALTDSTGAVAFADLASGASPVRMVRVVASHDPEGVVTSGDVDIAGPDRGSGRRLELTLSAAETITGTVTDAEDHPLPGALLSIEGMPWALPATAVSDGEGAFRLATVPHEAASLVATLRGYSPGKASLEARKASAVPAELVVHLRLVPGPPVEGDVVDADGHPVRARILACDGEPGEAHTSSAADGTFSLPPAAAGCAVIAVHDSFAPSDPSTAVAGRRLALRLRVGGSIEGVVVDDRGSVVSSFTVGIETSSAARGKSVRSGGQKAFDDRHGAFRLENLAPGTYVLSAAAPGKPPARSEPVEVGAGTATRGVRIVLASGGVVKGHVYDEQHAPLAGVDLSFDQVSSAVQSTAHTRTDDTGAFALEGAPAGPFTVRAEKEGFRMRLVAGLVAATGTTITQDFTLAPASGGANMELGGIGATLVPSREGVRIQAVFPGDPAEKSGLRAGDLIVRVDGEPTDTMSLTDVLQRLRGEAGTSVGISVRRGASDAFDALVVRAVVVH